MRADPVALQAATKAVESVWYQVSEAGSGGIGGAFERDLKAQTSGEPLWRSPSFVIACLLLPLAYFIAGNVSGLYGAEWTAEARAALLSSVATGIVMGLLGYYFGQTTTRNRTPS